MAGLHFDITADNTNLTQKLRETERSIKNMSSEVEREGESIESLFSRMTQAAAAFGAGFTATELIKNVVRVRGEFQQLEVAFTTMLGSQEKATALMSQLTETAAKTPFDLQGVANGARQLLAYGTSADDVNDTLIRLGNIAAGLSIPLNDLVYLYGTTMTQGRLYTEDLNQFTGRGIPMIRELAKEFGVAESEIKAMTEAGQIGFPEVQKVINNLTNEGGMFFNLMQEQSKTITGQISNIGDSFSMMLNEIGQANEGIINDALSGVSYLIENYETVGRTLLEIVGTYGAYKAALITITALQKAYSFILAQSALNQSLAAASGVTLSNAQALAATRTKLLQAAQAALNKTLLANPYVAAAAAVAALGLGIYKLATYQTEAEKAQERLNEAVRESKKASLSEQRELARLKGELSALKEGTDEYNAVKEKIISGYGKYYDGLEEEINKVGLTEEAYNKLTDAITRSYGVRQYQQFKSQQENELDVVMSENLGKIQDRLIDKLGEEAGSRYYAKIRDAIMQGRLEAINGTFNILGLDKDTYDALDKAAGVDGGLFDIVNRSIEGYIAEILNAIKLTDELDKKAQSKFGISGSQSNIQTTEAPFSAEGKSISQIEEELKKAQVSLESFKKALADGSGTKEAVSQQESYIKSLQNTILEREKDLKVISQIEAQISKLKKEQKETVYGSKEYNSIQSRINTLEAKLPQTKDERNRSEKSLQNSLNVLLNLRKENEDRQVELIQEGTERQIAEIKLRYDREIAEVEKLEEELKKTQGGNLTEEQQNTFNTAYSTIEKKREKEINVVNNEEQENERKKIKSQEAEWNEYLLKFGDYQQKRKAIVEKYNQQIAEAQTAGDAAMLYKEQQNALDELDNSIKGSTTLMGQLFADASEMSVNEIQKIIDKAELLIEYLGAQKDGQGNANINGENVSRQQILDLGISENSLQNLETSTDEVDALRRAIEKLKGELGSKSPFKSFEKGIKDAVNAIKSGDLAKGLEGIGNSIAEFAPAMSQFGKDIGTIFGSGDLGNKIAGISSAIGGLGQTAVGIGQAMSGDVIGGVMGAVGGIASIVSAFEGLFGADYSEFEAMKYRYEELSKVWDELISKKQEYIDISYGAEASKAYDEAVDILKQQQEYARQLAETRKNSGASAGSHSIAYRQNEWLRGYASELYQYVSQNGNYDDITNALLGATADQLREVKENMGAFWAGLDDEFQAALDQIIEADDKIDELGESLKSAFTGIDFDSFQDGFVSMLSDLESDNQDFADDLEKKLQNAIFSSLVANEYKERIKKLYEQWSDYAQSDGELTSGEAEKIREEYNQIVSDMLADRDALMEAMGWSAEQNEQQSASRGGSETITQDQASELSGRFTALYEVGLQILNNFQSLLSISVSVSEQNSILIEIRNLVISSNGHLEDISRLQKRIWEKLDSRLDSINNILNSKL